MCQTNVRRTLDFVCHCNRLKRRTSARPSAGACPAIPLCSTTGLSCRLNDRCCRSGVLPFGNKLENSWKPPERAAEAETFCKLPGNLLEIREPFCGRKAARPRPGKCFRAGDFSHANARGRRPDRRQLRSDFAPAYRFQRPNSDLHIDSRTKPV